MLRFYLFTVLSQVLFKYNESINNKKFNLFENHIKEIVKFVKNKVNPILLKLETNKKISSECSSSIRYTFKSASQMKLWAIQSKSYFM
jgi:hypothetical protein